MSTQKNTRLKVFLLLLLFATPLSAIAQTATDTLSEVRIKGRRRNASSDDKVNTFAPGQKVHTIDSLMLAQYQFQNIANLLSQQVPVFVKSYGVNSMASLSFRGASAAQSQVYWNGVPIQNAASGVSDVSLLPATLANRVNIVYGGSSALWGSGNVGGALLLETDRAAFDEEGLLKHSVSAVAGSFGQYQLGLRSSLATRRWSVGLNAFGQTADNGFRYRDGNTTRIMDNAALRSGVAMVNGAYKANADNTIGITAWYQQYYREIPRALFESTSLKNQRDESIRLLADWKRVGVKADVYSKLSFITDRLAYDDTLIALYADNAVNQVFAEVGTKYRFNNHHQLLVFVPVQSSWMYRELLKDYKYQNKAALGLAYNLRYFEDKLDAALNMRGEVVNDIKVLLPGLNATYTITNWLSLRANIQRSFRAPSLNELYYVPGGNDKLKPEIGWSQDAGYALKIKLSETSSLTHDLSAFNRLIDDWIIWFGGSIWTPHNISRVHSRGVETTNKLELGTGQWKWHLGINTSYILATTQNSYVSGDSSIGKQIPYMPRYNGQANFGFIYKGLYVNYNHTYTGYRFVTIDESQYLEPYTLGNLQLLYTLHIRKMPLQVSAQANNIWNVDYTVVGGRPMPRFNWLLGIRATLAN